MLPRLFAGILSALLVFQVPTHREKKGSEAPVAAATSRWKTFRSPQYGFTLRYPATHTVEVSSGHSPLAHPEDLTRFSINPKGKWTPESPRIDIDVANGRQFRNTRDYIRVEFDGRLRPDGRITLGGTSHKLYRFQGYHFLFIPHGPYILSFSSPTRRFLLAVVGTLRLQ